MRLVCNTGKFCTVKKINLEDQEVKEILKHLQNKLIVCRDIEKFEIIFTNWNSRIAKRTLVSIFHPEKNNYKHILFTQENQEECEKKTKEVYTKILQEINKIWDRDHFLNCAYFDNS